MSDKVGIKVEAYLTHPALVDTQRAEVEILVDAKQLEALVESLASRVSLWDILRGKLKR